MPETSVPQSQTPAPLPKKSPRKKRVASVLQNECVSCGYCVKVCPLSAISIFHGMYAHVDPTRCVGCAKCEKVCPASVITIREEGAAS